jgi:hypothetical protein
MPPLQKYSVAALIAGRMKLSWSRTTVPAPVAGRRAALDRDYARHKLTNQRRRIPWLLEWYIVAAVEQFQTRAGYFARPPPAAGSQGPLMGRSFRRSRALEWNTRQLFGEPGSATKGQKLGRVLLLRSMRA